ncbi:MAG: HNH endonuclease [Actinomycetia bacterium]|nr:HNH endonuclease [Actinomycetes bacterium]
MLLTFRGAPEPGQECRHLNGVRTDNRIENLVWGTKNENSADQVRHGTHRNARKTHCKRGHEFNDENTYVRANGTRLCLPCKRIVENAAYHRRRAAQAR